MTPLMQFGAALLLVGWLATLRAVWEEVEPGDVLKFDIKHGRLYVERPAMGWTSVKLDRLAPEHMSEVVADLLGEERARDDEDSGPVGHGGAAHAVAHHAAC